ncbi:InlB B-repeat-containing protein [Candidatus Saccharibacteria bacterium]|nr:InlB B-repeat-containing protein [Candidatus Saccharibacteria bacterium]
MQIRKKRALLRLTALVFVLFLVVLGVSKFINNVEDSRAIACNPNATGIDNAVCLQDMNDSVKASMTVEVPYALEDSRDGTPYQITKLSDGNVWMTQNLSLGTISSTIALSAADTDISMGSSFTTLPVAEARTDLDYYSVHGGFIEGGEKYIIFGGAGSPRDIVRDYGSSHYRIGNAYPWTIATAQTTNYVEPSNQTGINPAPTDSICPAGWKLPSQTEYRNLLVAYDLFLEDEEAGTEGSETTSAALRAAPFFFIRSFPYLLGTEGHYWTSTTAVETEGNLSYYVARVFFLSKDESGSSYRTDDIGSAADAVRCVARPDSSFSYTLSYNLNGASGAVESNTKTSSHKQVDMVVSNAEPTWAHHRFLGWADSSSATTANYEGGDTIALGGNRTLYAVWEVIVSDQVVSFEEDYITKTYGDSSFTNVATTDGDGTITYSSNNTDVAEVDSSTGLVTIRGAGTATITATAAETVYYRPASDTYTLIVNKKTSTAPAEISEIKNGYVTDALSTITLNTPGLIWKDSTTRIEEGANRYKVYYIENGDEDNYTAELFEIVVNGERRVYTVVDGDGQTYTLKGEQERISFIVDVDYSLFEEGGVVYVDSDLLDSDNYTVEFDEENHVVVISLLSSYLETLNAGKYNLSVYFNDGGIAKASFAVIAAEEEEEEEEENIPVPNTGSMKTGGRNASSDILFYIFPGGVVIALFVVRYIYRARKTHRKFEW